LNKKSSKTIAFEVGLQNGWRAQWASWEVMD
jgi:hypothetical protein